MNINWSGLGEVFVIALVAGVGLVTLFSVAIVSLGRREQGGAGATTATVVAGLCLLACVGIVGYGIYLVVAK